MSMNVLTGNPKTRGQLSLLLRDLGQKPNFHSSAQALFDSEHENTATSLLIDFSSVGQDDNLNALKDRYSELTWIGFQVFAESDNENTHIDRSLFDAIIVLPPHAERAKARLKTALRSAKTVDGQIKSPTLKTRSPFGYTRGATSKSRAPLGPGTSSHPFTALKTRYITSESRPAMNFVRHLRPEAIAKRSVLLTGDEGVEFELAARELNYQENADKIPMLVAVEDEISIDHLQRIERAAAHAKEPTNCYIGRIDDMDAEALEQLALFCEYLDNLRNPHLRLLIAYEDGSEAFFRDGVDALFATFKQRAHSIVIPSLRERPEDIASICHSVIGLLRVAHPFLLVRTISKDAIDYLIEVRAELSHGKLLRVLRNAMALSRRNILCVEDLKNYGDNELSNQHLIESMADEQYFPQEEQASGL